MRPEELAKQNFATLLDYLQSQKWRFQEEVEGGVYRVTISFSTEDFPLMHYLTIDSEDQSFIISSVLDFKVAFGDSLEIPAALALVNDSLIYGRFDLSISRERIVFFYAHYYGDNNISYDQYEHVISYSNFIVDRFNEKFFYLSKEKMSLLELAEFIKN